ncbi:MAG: sigma-70 family RNA polymerase sigma factor [Nitrospirae bacterium]|nr:sigma-70 family RNA polymerase sigma factor [Nitrospirota bacterium]
MSDLELVQGMARRDTQAFTAFYDRHASTVFSLLCRLLGDRSEAEDALQDTFWQVWRQAGAHDPSRGSGIAWLIQIARSRGLDRLRQVTLRTRRAGDPLDELADRLSTGTTTDQDAIRHETQDSVHQALVTLPSEQREAVMLAFFEGLTHPEIAERLGAPLGTVKTRIRLGMRKLQESLRATGVAE